MKKFWILIIICALVGLMAYFLGFKNMFGDNSSGPSNSGSTDNIKDTIQSPFSSHPNSDPEKAKSALERAGYDAEIKTYTAREDQMIARIDADNGSETESGFSWIVIYYYEDKEAAEAAWPELKAEGEDLREAAEYMGYASSFVCEKNGTMIYYGTKHAVSAAK